METNSYLDIKKLSNRVSVIYNRNRKEVIVTVDGEVRMKETQASPADYITIVKNAEHEVKRLEAFSTI